MGPDQQVLVLVWVSLGLGFRCWFVLIGCGRELGLVLGELGLQRVGCWSEEVWVLVR